MKSRRKKMGDDGAKGRKKEKGALPDLLVCKSEHDWRKGGGTSRRENRRNRHGNASESYLKHENNG